MKSKMCIILLGTLALICATQFLKAWPVLILTDKQRVEKAALIVVAHIKSDSITRTTHEHTAVLVITTVIKGEKRQGELPATLSPGLLPMPARFEEKRNEFRDLKSEHPCNGEKDVKIYDDNPDPEGGAVTDDVSKDQIWFLEVENGSYRIVYPGAAKPLSSQRDVEALVRTPAK